MARSSVVRSQMPSGVPSVNPGRGQHMDRGKPPFSKPHDLGNGGIPLKFYENMGEKSKLPMTTNPALSAPSAQGGKRSVEKARVPSNTK